MLTPSKMETGASSAAPNITAENTQLHAATLIRLRWFAIGAQTLTGVLASELLHLPVRIGDFLLVIAIEVVFNLIARTRLMQEHESTEKWLLGSITFDLFALTNLLFVSGGAFNPFTSLYIIQVAIASVMLPPRKTAVVVALSALGFALLFLSPSTVFGIPHGEGVGFEMVVIDNYHLGGMWTAHVIAAISVAFFTTRLGQQRRKHELKAMESAIHAERSRRLASLAALATGAAHEIATPLSTIAVAANELEDIAEGFMDEDILADARLIRQEVARCRTILDRMAVEAGYVRGDSVQKRSLTDFLDDALSRVHSADRIHIDIERVREFRSQRLNGALAHAVAAVLNNATLAAEKPVFLRAWEENDHLYLEIQDQGVGMEPDVIARATEPFFTTRDTGSGMGLGLFLAYNVSKTMEGDLEIESELGVGTTVRFVLPTDPDAPISLQKG